MGTESIEVTPATLIAHAGHVEAVATDVAQAKSAASGVSLGADAYGYLCTMVPLLLGQLQDMVIDGIAAATRSLDETGDQLRSAARDYAGADDANAALVDNVDPY